MLDHPQSGDQMEALKQVAQQLTPGRPVYDERGDKLGTVDEFLEEWGYFCMRRGLIFHRDLYVPLQHVGVIDETGVHLNVTRDYVDQHRWDQPPIEGGTSPTLGLGHTVPVPGAGVRQGADDAAPTAHMPQHESTQAAGEERDDTAETERAGGVGRLDEPDDPEQVTNPPLL